MSAVGVPEPSALIPANRPVSPQPVAPAATVSDRQTARL